MTHSNPFPSAQEKLALVGEPKMAAPNAQPAGNRPGPKGVNTHAPQSAGKPASSVETGNAGPGQGRTAPVVTSPTGKNKNRLH